MLVDCILEPAANILFYANAVHEVVDGFLERLPQAVVVDARGVDEADVVAREGALGQRDQLDAVLGRFQAHR